MAIILASNFEYKGKLPHFSNDQFATVADMKAYSENWLADGQISYCVETKKHYCYKVSNSVDATTGRWRILVEDVDASAVTSDTVKQVLIGMHGGNEKTIVPVNNKISISSYNDALTIFEDIDFNDETILGGGIGLNLKPASTSKAGIVKLNNSLTSTATGEALTAAQGKALNDAITTANGKITTNTNNISALTTKVNALNSAYRVKGTKATIAEVVALTDAVVGDVWNVTAAFNLGGKPYPAGTNVVCVTATSSSSHTESNWDALGGTVDLSPYAKASETAASVRVAANDDGTVSVNTVNKAGSNIHTSEIPVATTTANGAMSAADKANLDGLVSGTTPAGKATILATPRRIDGVTFNGATDIMHYGVCTTATGTVAKVVDIAAMGSLVQGSKIYVRFTTGNSAANATLNVHNLGAKPIYYGNAAVSTGAIKANRTYTLVYDTTLVASGVWMIVGDIDTNTTYNNFTGATSSAAGSQGLVPAPTSGKINQILRSDGVWADANSVINTADCFNRVLKVDSIVSGVTVLQSTTTSMDAKVYFNSTTNRFIAGVTSDGTTTYYNNWANSTYYASSDYYGTHKDVGGVYSENYKSVLVELNSGELRKYGYQSSSSSVTLLDTIIVNKAKALNNARKINGISFDGTADIYNHVTNNLTSSTTDGWSVAKPGFTLAVGSRVSIKMPGNNLSNIPHTLNVANTGAKPILINGSTAQTDKWISAVFGSTMVFDFVYDGTNWNIVGALTSEPTLDYDVVSTVSDIVLS